MSAAADHPVEAGPSRSPYAGAPRLPAGEGLTGALILEGAAGSPVGGGAVAGSPVAGLELEIGPGRGGFIIERLAASADVCIIGLEIRLKWASLVDERVRGLGYGARGRVFAEDIRLALPRFASGSLSKVFIHFPDPWWKKRHEKRRLAQLDVMGQLARALGAGGELFVQTDVWDTAQAYRQAIEALPDAYEPFGDDAGSPLLAENPYGARSPRERRVMTDGMPIIRMRFRRRAGGVVA